MVCFEAVICGVFVAFKVFLIFCLPPYIHHIIWAMLTHDAFIYCVVIHLDTA